MPQKKQLADYFLHVLFVDDAGAKAVNPGEVKMSGNADKSEIKVAGWKMTFYHLPGTNTRIDRIK